MNITIQGVDITLTQKQIKTLQAKLPKKSIIERIQIIGDVYKELGVWRNLPYKSPTSKLERYLNACYDIAHITQAYNEGWTPDFTNTPQPKYYLYFERTNPGARGGWVVCSFNYCFSFALGGFGLHFETREKALDAAKKFIDIWNDYLPE